MDETPAWKQSRWVQRNAIDIQVCNSDAEHEWYVNRSQVVTTQMFENLGV